MKAYFLKNRTWLLGLLVGLFFCSFNFEDSNFFVWSAKRKLTWSDFKGIPPENSNGHSAVTESSVKVNYRLWNDSMECNVFACFFVNKSWVLDSSRLELLNHEQRHFDLSEIQARKLREYLSKWKKGRDFQTYLSFGRDSINQFCHHIQDQYDIETNHSLNRNAQNQWDKKIDSLLSVYNKYESTLVKIK